MPTCGLRLRLDRLTVPSSPLGLAILLRKSLVTFGGIGEGVSVTPSQPLAAGSLCDFVSVTGFKFVTDD